MKSFLGWITLFCCVFLCSQALAGAPSDLAGRLEAVGPAHPRLFFTDAQIPDLKAKIEGDALLSGAYRHLLCSADALIDVPVLQREKIGKRLLGVSRACLQRVSYLAFAWRMTGDAKYVQRAQAEMVAAASFSDWNPSHFLDVAEMTTALAIGYDWLYNALDPQARDAIGSAIVEKGLKPSLKGGWWVNTTNNWNQVCHGGLAVGALAVLEDERPLAAKVIERALENVPKAMHEYEPDGVYPEGASYWAYGTTYNLILIDALQSVLGSDFGLSSTKGFMSTADYYLHLTGPTSQFFNFSDCGTQASAAAGMHWFARRRQDPSLLWHEKRLLEAYKDRKPNTSGGDRMLPFLLLWSTPVSGIGAPGALCWSGQGATPVAMLRSGWDEDATFVGIKGGSPSSSHAHMDTGSFVLDMSGTRWAVDLGSQGYHSLESRGVDLWNRKQDGGRWTVYRLNNFSHSTLVVDGQMQRVDGSGAIRRVSLDGSEPFAIVDMAGVYTGQLAGAVRGVRLIGKSVLIQDEVQALDKETNVRWAMMTKAKIKLEDGGKTAVLSQKKKRVRVRVVSPAEASLEVQDAENPPRDYDEKNPGARLLVLNVVVPPSAKQQLAVTIAPGDAAHGHAAHGHAAHGHAGDVRPALETIDNW